jgi:membrane protein
MVKKIKKAWQLALEIYSVWSGGNASSMGAAVAYYTIFAIAPLFILVLALAGFLFGPEAAQRELFGQLSSLTGREGAEAIQNLLAAVDKPRANTLAMGTAILGMPRR